MNEAIRQIREAAARHVEAGEYDRAEALMQALRLLSPVVEDAATGATCDYSGIAAALAAVGVPQAEANRLAERVARELPGSGHEWEVGRIRAALAARS